MAASGEDISMMAAAGGFYLVVVGNGGDSERLRAVVSTQWRRAEGGGRNTGTGGRYAADKHTMTRKLIPI